MDSFDISRLASEILLFIFLHLDLNQIVLSRRVNKQFQEVIDNNQPLWRVFEWRQKAQESFKFALDLFDEKSRSSLEKVSIQEKKSQEEDLLHLVRVLKRSKETLREVMFKVPRSTHIGKAVELLTGSKLRSLVVWGWGSETYRNSLPRLAASNFNDQTSCSGKIQLLWVYEGVGNLDSKHLESLISFAQGRSIEPQDCRKLISSFSDTIVHLRLVITREFSTIVPFFCPNLKVFEGWVVDGLSSFFDAPQLQILVLGAVEESDFDQVPPSVEEIWLRNRCDDLNCAEEWEPLLRQCPRLRILKLTEDFVLEDSDIDYFVFTGLLEVLEMRNKIVQDEKEIDEIKMVSLQKLILPTSMLNREEINRAAEVAEEVIDVKGYPEYIEIKY